MMVGIDVNDYLNRTSKRDFERELRKRANFLDESKFWNRRRRYLDLEQFQVSSGEKYARTLAFEKFSSDDVFKGKFPNRLDPRNLLIPECVDKMSRDVSALALAEFRRALGQSYRLSRGLADPSPSPIGAWFATTYSFLSPQTVARYLHEESIRRRALADRDEESDYVLDKDEDRCLVQHLPTGLRINGKLPKKSSHHPIGTVSANLPGDDNPGDARNYVGMGVGRRLYLRLAESHPDYRWAKTTLRAGSVGVRRYLHAQNPFRWEGDSCGWCLAQSIHWHCADLTTFVGHQN